MTNNPAFYGGATDVAAGAKAARLMQLCDTFHLPLISLVDEPGLTEMPWISVVLRRVYGVAGQCHHRPTGMFSRVCSPFRTAEATGQDVIDPARPGPRWPSS